MHRYVSQRTFVALLVVVLSCVLVLSSVAQETTANLQGYVKDPTGAVVTKATVEVTGTTLIGSKKTEADSQGYFRFNNLPPGEYTLSVNASGFRTFKQTGIKLETGRFPSVEVALQMGAATETVEVSGEAPIVDVTQSKVSVTVSEQVLENIPKGRSFQSVIPFAPGARQEPLQSNRMGQSRNSGFQIDGASDGENVYLIDGMNVTNIQAGGVGKNFVTDFVQEVQIKSSSFEAEFGGALGGVVNAVPKRGSNSWHGELKTYLNLSALNANDPCSVPGSPIGTSSTTAQLGVNCFLRTDPATSLNTTTRTPATAQYYIPQKDSRRTIEPGFEIGGPILKDRLWLFTSYIPTLDSIHRTINFTGNNPGLRTLTQTYTQHNAYTRLDYRLLNSLRLFAGWTYGYARWTGTLVNPDSPYGQRNTSASTDPNTLRPDQGVVLPSSIYSFGGDWTPTSKLVVQARFGYTFLNGEDRGKSNGVRYFYNQTVNAASRDLAGNPFPTSSFNTSGFANISDNFTTYFDAYKRKSLNVDASYYVGHLWGSHNFKWGYFWMNQGNEVLSNYNTSRINLDWNNKYTPVTSTTACDGIIAQNVAQYGASANQCRGLYGFFTVTDGVDNQGQATSTAHALYIQDAWNPGYGLTLNLGVRFDREHVPAYDPNRFQPVDFGFADKIAPRIGGAYDLLHNGKVKVYASYGKFFDIMKLGLPRGSFGSDYWHDCVYALDTTNYASIVPTNAPGSHSCPTSGGAVGVSGFRFIENVDFRATKIDPRDPAIQPDIKPMLQHEYVAGVDWAITPNWSLETRYSRKTLDRTIEDMAITDNLGFYIGNPGSSFADVLHRQVLLDPTVGLVGPLCAECPAVVPAIRRYDGVEFRLMRRPTNSRWFGSLSYTYSRLHGNYSGLTDTDITDGNGGRHNPNNHRAFDLPTMTYLPNGKIDDGPLPTDRPNTLKIFGYYRLPWWHQETWIGFQQAAFQGTPNSTCLAVVGSSSACQWAEGRGNFVDYSRAANGDFVVNGVEHNSRTDFFTQTDLNVRHEIKVSKSNENLRLGLEMNIQNLFNQRAVLARNELTFASSNMLISPSRPTRFPGDPGVDWNKLMTGYDYTQAINSAKLTLSDTYGKPILFQGARNMRLAIKFIF